MYGLTVVAVLIISITMCNANGVDVGAGTLYKLDVVEDVWLERPTWNYNNHQWLIVGKLTQFPKKRSLLRFNDIPSACTTVNHAMMYIYYSYSHKACWHSVYQAPFITCTIQAHRVLKSWKETEATTTMRYSGAPWHKAYLGLDDTGANDCPTGQATIYADRPAGFVETEVTSAVKDWKDGKPNYGLLIWATNEDQDGRDTRFYSRSYNDSTKFAYIQLNCN